MGTRSGKQPIRRRNMDAALQRWIESEAHLGFSPAEIDRRMRAEPQFFKKDDLPSLRTIRRVVNDVRIEDPSGTWGIKDADAEDARLVLDTLAYVILETQGKKCTLTITEAEWVLRVRKVAPDASPHTVWRLAREYMRLESRGIADSAPLDQYLAFKPWKSANGFANYSMAVDQGWIPQDTLGLWGVYDRFMAELGIYPDKFVSPAEIDPWLQLLRRALLGLEWPRPEEIERMRKENPELYQRLDGAFQETYQKSREFLKGFIKRGERPTPEDGQALMSLWEELHRLTNSAGGNQ